MKIAFFISYPQRMSGANQVLLQLVLGLSERITPVVIITAEGAVSAAYRNAGIPVHVVPTGPALSEFGGGMWSWSYPKRLWVAVTELLPYTVRLCRLTAKLRPDIVHLNDIRGAVLAGLAFRIMRRPIVAHLHGEITYSGLPVRVFERFSTRIVTVCTAIKDSLSAAGRAKAVTVYNPVRPIRASTQSMPWVDAFKAAGGNVICCIASVVPFKGYHHLLNALALLNKRGWSDKYLCICVGDLVQEYEAYWSWLMRRQRELQVNNVTFAGWQPNPAPFYSTADMTVLPSANRESLMMDGVEAHVLGGEGFPMTHLEAMSCGLPVVGTDNAGVPEMIVHGETGLIVSKGDDLALAEAIESLLRDPDRRKRMGENGRARAATHFTLAESVERVANIYDEILKRRTGDVSNSGRRLKVVYYISYPLRMAGASTSLLELITHLPPNVEATTIIASEGPVREAYAAAGVNTIVLSPGPNLLEFGGEPLHWSFAKFLRVLLFQAMPHTVRLWLELRRIGADIVHVNDIRGAVLAGPACVLARRPMVGHLRGEITLGGIWPKIFERTSSAIVTVSKSAQESLSLRARAKAVTVYNGISGVFPHPPVSRWVTSLRQSGIAILCSFASVVPFKGHWTLLRAVKILNDRGFDNRFVLFCVGDIPEDPASERYWRWLRSRQAELDIRNVTFTGWCKHPAAFYSECDISVLASANHTSIDMDGDCKRFIGAEGFPRTNLEAMWYGIPVVSTDNAGASEQIVDGVTGYIVPTESPEALADALEALLLDQSLRRSMGTAGRDRVKRHFGTPGYVEGVMRVYDGVLSAV